MKGHTRRKPAYKSTDKKRPVQTKGFDHSPIRDPDEFIKLETPKKRSRKPITLAKIKFGERSK